SATNLVRRHWITGQSELENENLATLDAWIEPADGSDGFATASQVEDVPIGPLLAPDQDNAIFEKISELNQIRNGSTDPRLCARAAVEIEPLIRPQIDGAWQLLWRAIGREREFSAGAHAGQRWAEDRRAYTGHVDWSTNGRRRRARDSVKRAAVTRELQ